MPYGRYDRLQLIDDMRQESYVVKPKPFGYTDIDLSKLIDTVEYVVVQGDRIDTISAKQLGDDSYWPIIARLNNLAFPLGPATLYPGRVLKIPVDVNQAIEILP